MFLCQHKKLTIRSYVPVQVGMREIDYSTWRRIPSDIVIALPLSPQKLPSEAVL